MRTQGGDFFWLLKKELRYTSGFWRKNGGKRISRRYTPSITGSPTCGQPGTTHIAPRTLSEEPNPSSYMVKGPECPTQSSSLSGLPAVRLEIMSCDPALAFSSPLSTNFHCEGSFVRGPNSVVGPSKILCPYNWRRLWGRPARWRRRRLSQLSSQPRFVGFPPSPATCSRCSDPNSC